MVLLASWCGLRLGELTELRRSDVDLGDGVIRVRRAMVCVGGEFRITTPKSEADIRDVNIQRARRQMPAMPGGEYQRVLVDTDVTCHVIGCRQQVRRDDDISDVRL